ncbi:MAG: DUF5658 family protein [Promethearchaeota archaeon]
MIILGIFLFILQILDIFTTNIGIKLGCEEVNPVLRKSVKRGVPVKFIILKLSLSLFLSFLLLFGNIVLNWLLVGLNIFCFIVVLSNIINIQIQKRWNIKCEIKHKNSK